MIRLLACLLVTLGCSMTCADDGPVVQLKLNQRHRIETQPKSGRWHSITESKPWTASETAIVICDMWDKHWCPQATGRVGEMAPRMNQLVQAARDQGVLIIHCPSDTLDFYKDTPGRKLAQAAPKVATTIDLQRWCHIDEAIEGAALPIDDSDGGCDCEDPIKSYRAWSRQHPAIQIEEGDAITDSAEAFYLMKQRGIKNVMVMGVHTNMCVLGRPFSIRQMVQQGQNVVLVRDMTDTMYNPKMAPFVSHFTGTDLVVEHIEKYWCPTILSTDLLGGEEFRFKDDHRKHVVVLCAEREYRTHESLPKFAAEHLGHDFRVSFVWDDADDGNHLPGVNVIPDADVLLISMRRRTLPKAQLRFVRDFVAAGKPVIGIRTASHAFTLRNKPAPEGLSSWPEFDAEVFGGNYTNHYGNDLLPTIAVAKRSAPAAFSTLTVSGELKAHGSLYKVSPLKKTTTTILTGSITGQAPEPVAWFNTRADGGISFYTSLGHINDFEQPVFAKLLKDVLILLTETNN